MKSFCARLQSSARRVILCAEKRKKGDGELIVPILRSILLSALIGWLAGILAGDAKRGFWKNWLVGFIGSALGGVLAEKLSISGGRLTEFVCSVAGGCIVLWIAHLLTKK